MPGKENNQPIRRKSEVQESNDERIDEDFPVYPHHPSKDGDMDPRKAHDRRKPDVDRHNGSARAFEGTEDPSGGDE